MPNPATTVAADSASVPPRESAPVRARWPETIWTLLGGTLLVRAAGFAYPFMSYFLHGLGYGPGAVGAVLAAFGGGWIAGQLVCGWLADRIGRRRTLVVSMVLAAVILPLLAASRSMPAVLSGAVLAGVVYDAPRPVVSAVVADLVPDDTERARINGWRHGAVNVGGAITGAIGGLLAGSLGMPALFWLNSIACALFAVVVLARMARDTRGRASRAREGSYREAVADGRLWLVAFASLGPLTCILGMLSALPLLMSAEGLPPSAFGWVQVANSITVVILTPVMNPWLSRLAAGGKPLLGIFAAGSLVLGVTMAWAALAHSTVGYGLAVSAGIPGEIGFFVAATDIVNRIAPERSRGRYHGVFGMTLASASVLAPALASWSLGHGGKAMSAFTTLMAGVLGAVMCLPLARATRRRSNRRHRRPGGGGRRRRTSVSASSYGS